MYTDTVTVFNRRKTQDGDIWYPKVLKGVNLNLDKSAVVSAYGEQSQDTAILNVRVDDGNVYGYLYLLPKEWQKGEDPAGTITFQTGLEADFFWAGKWTGGDVISNDGYGLVGFRDYMERNYDHVYEVTGVADFSVIPHLEITGK